MDKNLDFTSYSPFDTMNSNMGMNFDPNLSDIYKDPMFNPMMQYEQAYMYYRYMCMQMEYKIKCKEYEKMCNTNSRNERKVE